MKKHFEFSFKNFSSLPKILKNGLVSFHIKRGLHGRPDAIWLGMSSENVLKINSVVSSVGPWDEIGSLVFELVDKDRINFDLTNIDKKWMNICCLKKLVFEDNVVIAESGLSIKAKNSEIIITSSSFPYSVEILAKFLSEDFSPECKIKNYNRIAIN